MSRRRVRPKRLTMFAGRPARLLLGAVLLMLAGLAAWLVLAGRGLERTGTAFEVLRPPAESGGRGKLYFEDFVLQQPESDRPEIYLWREPTPRWDDAQVDRYWIDPAEITLEFLTRRNDEQIEKLLEEVP